MIVIRHKIRLMLRYRNRWPKFVSFEEDKPLWKEIWDQKYEGKRIKFCDNTNIDLNYKPSMAQIQRISVTVYYGGNCVKGGIHPQPCG